MRSLVRIGWLVFLLAWIPFIFVVTGMKGGAIGEVVDNFFGGWIVLMFLAFGSSMVMILSAVFLLPAVLDAYMGYRGLLAFGRIVKVSDSGARINDRPVMNIDISVEPDGSPPFKAVATKTAEFTELGSLTPGQGVTVRYVPRMKHVKLLKIGTDKEDLKQRLMSDPYNAASGQYSFFGFLAKLGLVFALPVLIIGFVAFIFLLAPKYTEVYACTSEAIVKNEKAKEILGEPISLGYYAFGNYHSSDVTEVFFTTPISGSKSSGSLDVDSVKSRSRYRFKMRLRESGRETTLYDGEFPCSVE